MIMTELSFIGVKCLLKLRARKLQAFRTWKHLLTDLGYCGVSLSSGLPYALQKQFDGASCS